MLSKLPWSCHLPRKGRVTRNWPRAGISAADGKGRPARGHVPSLRPGGGAGGEASRKGSQPLLPGAHPRVPPLLWYRQQRIPASRAPSHRVRPFFRQTG